MRTKAHWEACKELASFHAANNLAFQLREIAKAEGFCPHGIKVLDKRETINHGSHADAQVHWHEGPDSWTQLVELAELPGVCADVEDECTISYYDV